MPRRIGRGTMGTGRRGKRWEANTVALIKSRAVFPRNAKKVVSSYLPEGSNRPLQFSRSPPLCARHERVRWSRLRAFVLFFREAFIGSRLLSPLYRLFLIHPCKTSLPIIRILLYPPTKRYLLYLSLCLLFSYFLVFFFFKQKPRNFKNVFALNRARSLSLESFLVDILGSQSPLSFFPHSSKIVRHSQGDAKLFFACPESVLGLRVNNRGVSRALSSTVNGLNLKHPLLFFLLSRK